VIYYLSLGSNLGDRRGELRLAVDFLRTLGSVERISGIYETEPQGMSVAGLFLNLAAALETPLEPEALLASIKAYESSRGRDLENSHCQPRPIDIDILLAGKCELDTPALTVPHPRVTERAFVLLPLAEIAPGACHPQSGKTVAELAAPWRDDRGVRRIGEL